MCCGFSGSVKAWPQPRRPLALAPWRPHREVGLTDDLTRRVKYTLASFSNGTIAYSDDGDRRFRFIVTGLERVEVLDVNDNSVGHDGLGVGTGFGCLSWTA
jgi:hypothetical protein